MTKDIRIPFLSLLSLSLLQREIITPETPLEEEMMITQDLLSRTERLSIRSGQMTDKRTILGALEFLLETQCQDNILLLKLFLLIRKQLFKDFYSKLIPLFRIDDLILT